MQTSTHRPDDQVFLHSTTKLEPLAFRWYAWPHLLPPLQHALNMAFRHIPLLQSFLTNPSAHVRAAADLRLLGGPFIDVPSSEVEQLRSLLQDTQERGRQLLELANEFKEYDRQLQAGATGSSMDEFYSQLPQSLRGCVELAYDLNNHPSIRTIEDLLYEESSGQGAGQELCLTSVGDAARKFFLTTPRIEDARALFLRMSFLDPRIDVLSSMRTTPLSRGVVLERLGLDHPGLENAIQPFLTSTPPQRRSPDFSGSGIRVRHFGHACVLLQTASTSILIDPLTALERDDELATLTFHDLPDYCDFVVFTHAHMDHFCPEMILQLRKRVGRFIVPRSNPGDVADPSMRLMLKALGACNVTTLEPFESVETPDGQITSLPFPGEHCGLGVASKQSLLINLLGKQFLFLVDSDAVDSELYIKLSKRVGAVDALFVGMECRGSPLTWFYGPLLTRPISRKADESRRGNASNCQRAWNAIKHITCPQIFVYAMGNEPWNRHLLGLEYSPTSVQITESTELVNTCLAAGRRAERLRGCREMHF